MQEKQDLQRAIGQRIRDIRIQKNISQQDMAAFCNFEKANYCRIESGRTNPTIFTLYVIAKHLQVSLGELIGEI